MTARLLNVRFWLLTFLLAAVIVLAAPKQGPFLDNDQSQQEMGHGIYLNPVDDCGHNYFGRFWYPHGVPCLKGAVSQDELDKVAEERGIPDMPIDEALQAFRELLNEFAQAWGMVLK